MPNILSIQSHVSYGYVGNKAATFPLQSLGLEVWTVHTVQFSNHTGYGDWKGQVFSAQHIADLIQGLEAQGLAAKCDGILSGYMGDRSIGKVIINTVERFKKINPNLLYLGDPVMGSNDHKCCFVQEDIPPFFKEYLSVADIITPNHFEAEMLYGAKINNTQQLKQAAYFFHQQGIKTVMVTDLQWEDIYPNEHCAFFSDQEIQPNWLVTTPKIPLDTPINGSGDLFSALYLGFNLLGYSQLKSFEYAFNKTQQIIMETTLAKQRELKILGHHYCAHSKLDTRLTPI